MPKVQALKDINWPREILASGVVFLVALPLCMGIAIASGVPPALGLITGIVGGLIVGWIAGSPLQVSGPAAGLTVLVWQLVKDHGLAALGVAVLAAGLLQIVAGYFKLGRWFRAVSPALIQGMLAGIGALIFVSQFHVMVDDKPRGGGLANLLSIPESVIKGVFPIDGNSHHLAAYCGLTTIVVIVAWNKLRPERLKAVPGPLMGVVAGSMLAYFGKWEISMVEVPHSLVSSFNTPAFAAARKLLDPAFASEALGIAIIASGETLLCAAAVDKISKDSKTDYDRELMAQGVGNAICGMLGALPMTGVIVRSSANVDAGAKTRYSAVMHGAWLLALVGFLPFVLAKIPTASLAGILVFTGYKLAHPSQLVKLYKVGRGEALVFVATVVAIVATDLLKGVAVGLVMAAAKLLVTFSHLDIDVDDERDGIIEVSLHGAATFVKLPVLADTLDGLPEGKEIHVHIGGLAYIDHACMEILGDWKEAYDETGAVSIEWDDLLIRHETANPAWGGLADKQRAVALRKKVTSNPPDPEPSGESSLA
jgi:MFS superfamily sulfate permease-like transporter